MTETEYKKLRDVRIAIYQYGQKYKWNNDLTNIHKMVRKLMDDHLYIDYKKALNSPEYISTVENSTHADFIDHMKRFIKEYENKYPGN